MLARRVLLGVSYNDKDISEDIAKFVKSFSFNDVMSGEADDVNITLEDRDELWSGDWLPDKGAMLDITLGLLNWKGQGSEELKLGKFQLDEFSTSGPPNEVSIKGVSVPDNNELRGVDKNRSWEKVKFSAVAKDIADGAGMELFFDVEDKDLDRVEQTDESDLACLQKLCSDNGAALKVTDNTIVIFDEWKYEQKDPVNMLIQGVSPISRKSFKTKLRDTYKACHVKYQESESAELIEYTFTDPSKEDTDGKTLEVNEQVKTIAEAENLAKKKLREKNCDEVTATLELMGSFDYMAGNCVQLKGFHAFDGKYIITKAGHSIGSGYTVSLEIRRCLDGY